MKFISLFAGIGGLDLGLERSGMECVAQVEIDEYCRKVLAKHWPEVPKYADVREVGILNLPSCDVIAGGFPCQDVSLANAKRTGLDGARSGLWSEFYRIICELRPSFVIVENTTGLLVPTDTGPAPISGVLSDLAACWYHAEWRVLRASDFGARHRRERVFIVAYPHCLRMEGRSSEPILWKPHLSQRQDRKPFQVMRERYDTPESRLCRTLYGIPNGVDRVRALGNAVVPQVAEYIGRCIMEFENAA